jgi:sugar phosphate isomerase/epimerase
MGELTRRKLLTSGGAAAALASLEGTRMQSAEAASKEPPFKLGTVSYNVPKDWDLPTLCKLLPQAGIKGIEFRTTHAHGVEPSLSSAQRADVKARCAAAGLEIWGLGTVCEFQSPDPAVVRKNIEDCFGFISLAKDLGAKGVKVRPNGLPKDVPVEKTLEQIGRALQECGKRAGDNGVEIFTEVHGLGTQEPANMRTIMEACGHKSVGVCWNSNPTDVKDGSVKHSFKLLKPYLKSCHINNLWGDYPYEELFRLLRKANYTGYTLCEVGTPVKAEDGVVFFQCYRGLWRELCRG